MSRTISHNKYTTPDLKARLSKLARMRQKYNEFLVLDMWYEELPIRRKARKTAA